MKYVLIIGDGMADRPLEELGGKTPLQVAEKPNTDWIASHGRRGMLKNVPDGMEPGSDVAIMSIMGYNPAKYYTGRGPLEAVGMGIELDKNDVAFRCNLITERNGLIEDYSADHISTEEAEDLISLLNKKYSHIGDFHLGVGYRHLLQIKYPEKNIEEVVSTSPHDVVGEKYKENLLKPTDLDLVRDLNRTILDSRELLSNHPVNVNRVKNGKKPANSIWLWGQGRKPNLESMKEKYGLKGAVISAVTLVKGLGNCSGMEIVDVPGATGYYDTSYENKAEYGLRALENNDLVLIHVEAPDEAGHAGDIEKKIEAIENLDKKVVGRVLDELNDDYTILVTADHPTPIQVKKHVADPVPFAFYSPKIEADESVSFDEFSASKGSEGVLKGHNLMRRIISS